MSTFKGTFLLVQIQFTIYTAMLQFSQLQDTFCICSTMFMTVRALVLHCTNPYGYVIYCTATRAVNIWWL